MSASKNTPEQRIKQKKESLKASTKSPFMFPLDVTSSFIYMHIVPHKVQVGELLKDISLKYSEEGGAANNTNANTLISALGGGARARPVAQNKKITERSIILPIPEKLADKLSVSYNASQLGVSAAMFSAGQSLNTAEGTAALRSAGGYVGRQMLQNFSQELGDLFALGSQSVPNPYSTIMFKNVEQRTFEFSYTFAPTSQKESEALKKIINALRYLSLPGEDLYFLDFPYEFEISFVGSDFLYAFSRGYISDISVDFGGDGGVSFFETTSGGAAPSIVKLAFNFREIYPLSRNLIDQGGAQSMKVDKTFFGEEQERINSLPPFKQSTPEEQTERQKQGTELANRENASRYTGLGCVCIDSIVFDGRKASEVEVGDELDTIDPITNQFKKQIVTRSETKLSECVRITTESGIQLDCSISAPISDEHGNQVLAPTLCGVMIPVIDNEEHKLERVVSVEEIGMKKIRHITVNDSFFPAGKEANRYILHHNKQ